MNLHEYQAKRLFAAAGIPVPEGDTAATAHEAEAIASRLGGRVAIKAQVLTGGRGKAGGIVLADTPAEARTKASRLLGAELKGLPVRRVLVERAIEIADELYAAFAVDRRAGRMALIISSKGGVDIEETARTEPEAIRRIIVDPFLGLRPYQVTAACAGIGLGRPLWPSMQHILGALYGLARDRDATLAEINPLVVTADSQLLALDAKMTIDDSALFRQPELSALRDPDAETPVERQAREAGISYVRLAGRIGCMVNGAGLAMATMDVIKLFGGEPANFLDIGGGARADRVERALRIILSDANVAAVLINIFGGITRCDEVARGILAALEQVGAALPIVVRLVGTNEAEGRDLLDRARITTARTLTEGARLAVASAMDGAG